MRILRVIFSIAITLYLLIYLLGKSIIDMLIGVYGIYSKVYDTFYSSTKNHGDGA